MNLDTLEGDKYTDDAGNVKISKLFKDAMVLDDTRVARILAPEIAADNIQQGDNGGAGQGEFGERDDLMDLDLDIEAFVRADEAWYPRDPAFMLPVRRRHPPLPLPGAAGSGAESTGESESSTDTDGEAAVNAGEVFDAITTDRVLKQRILTGPFSILATVHLNLIIRTLRRWEWLSDAFRALPLNVQRQIFMDEMEPKKWKTMVMARQFTGLAFMPPLVHVKITGTESPHWARTTSNAWIYYRGPNTEKLYGEVLFFISVKDARHWPFDQRLDPEPEPVYLAVVKRYYPVRVGCLLKIPNRNPRTTVEVIETGSIEDEVGLIQCNRHQYVAVREGGSYILE
ncbi:MAG: hypothetical protein ACE3JU_15325 [Paenibacillus sp.]|uniref:hypothetical protein n=1 Tax=Paenibacillus sp. TaxID=58172 RepID=UPI003B7807FC